jgi:hypothetical protein
MVSTSTTFFSSKGLVTCAGANGRKNQAWYQIIGKDGFAIFLFVQLAERTKVQQCGIFSILQSTRSPPRNIECLPLAKTKYEIETNFSNFFSLAARTCRSHMQPSSYPLS